MHDTVIDDALWWTTLTPPEREQAVIAGWLADLVFDPPLSGKERAELYAAVPACARALAKALRGGYGTVEVRLVASRVETPIRILTSAGEPIKREREE